MTKVAFVEGTMPDQDFKELMFDNSRLTALRCLGSSVYTLYNTPEHWNMQRDVTAITHGLAPQQLEPSLDVTTSQVKDVISSYADLGKKPTVSPAGLLMLGSFLIQNTDLSSYRSSHISFPYHKIEDLHDAITDYSVQSSEPVGVAEQLRIALGQSDGNVAEAQWRLLVTSRLHARWLDNNIVTGIPRFTADEKIARMIDWQNSITAFKNPEGSLSQDTNGDNYYMWTHAFAKTLFSLAIPDHKPRLKSNVTAAFHHGTTMMRNLAQKVRPQSVPSDHTNASNYGNAVGQTCVDTIMTSGQETFKQDMA